MLQQGKYSLAGSFVIKASRLLTLLSLLLLGIFTRSCIEPYLPKIDEDVDLISVEASIVKGEEKQKLVILKATSLVYPQYQLIKGCKAFIIDDQGNEFAYTGKLDGTYEIQIPDESLVFNRKYMLKFTTPNGDVFESDFETLNEGAEVDTIYNQVEDKIDNLTGEYLRGVQFYIDLKAPDTLSRYFRWNLEETYEYTSVAPVTYYLSGGGGDTAIVFPQNIWEVYRCWRTAPIHKLFLSSTVNLVVNEKKRIPLNYVSTETERLKIKYSLFVKQYTLTEAAYDYWLKNKNDTQESGGLYTQQPGQPISNIHQANDPEKLVLGFFWVSHKTEQRIFLPRINSLPVFESCILVPYVPKIHSKGPYPRYVYFDEEIGEEMTASNFCFNCTFKGGVLKKPDFWE